MPTVVILVVFLLIFSNYINNVYNTNRENIREVDDLISDISEKLDSDEILDLEVAIAIWNDMLDAHTVYQTLKDSYPASTIKNYDLIFVVLLDYINLIIDMTHLANFADSLQNESDPGRLAPRIEILTTYYEKVADTTETFNTLIGEIMRTNDFVTRYLGLTDQFIAIIDDSIDIYRSTAADFRDIIQQYKELNPEYISVRDRMFIHDLIRRPPIHIVPIELATFFDSFDVDNSGTLDIGEGEQFFNWVERNIQYRYDDENATDTIPGYPVGDGRPGSDYWQSPWETYTERMGDCEDMAILSVAFYTHFGIDARMATVNAETEMGYDHAICIVKIGEDIDDYIAKLGEMCYYEIEGSYYMLVDNAYSGIYGTISGDIDFETHFLIHEIYYLEEAYNEHH